jgi:type II secretory pathway pseudopilin PulG
MTKPETPPALPAAPNKSRAGLMIAIGIALAVGLIVVLILAAVSLPQSQFKTARTRAAETVAISTLRTINTAEVQYQAQFAHYAASLKQLGPSFQGTQTESAAGLISPALASGADQYYKYDLKSTSSGYAVIAVPLSFPQTEARTFYSDQFSAIREARGPNIASAASPELR